MSASDRDDCARFENELRAWGGRPGRLSTEMARRRVLSRLPLVRAPFPWLRLAAAAALLVALAVAVWRGSPRPGREVAVGALGVAPLDRDVVVWVLDAHTTVYFVLGPDGPVKGGVS